MVMGELAQETEVLVIGSGPGGYAAAFQTGPLHSTMHLVSGQSIELRSKRGRWKTRGTESKRRYLQTEHRGTLCGCRVD